MISIYEQRLSDSPYIETITHGRTLSTGSTIRPAETNWHMVLVKHEEQGRLLVVGPWSTAGIASWGGDAEILWIKFTLGTFMPHLPTKQFRDTETQLPGATGNAFWLHSTTWQFPTPDNVEMFIKRLVHDDVLVHDPIIDAVLQGRPHDMSDRTVRHRFLRATGLTQSHIFQYERAQRAAALLEQGVSILDTTYETGYFDQPHLTRSLKQFVGFTPAQVAQLSQPT